MNNSSLFEIIQLLISKEIILEEFQDQADAAILTYDNGHFIIKNYITNQVIFTTESIFSYLIPGAQGSIGSIGDNGIDGAQGAQGNIGDKGGKGPQGIQGPQGSQGGVGNKGIKGDRGVQGAQGAQGSVGSAGHAGEKGDRGRQGLVGRDGPQGFSGASGVAGTPGIDNNTAGAQGVQGTNGAQGPIGAPGVSGVQGPKGAQGIQGQRGDTGAAPGAQGPAGDQGMFNCCVAGSDINLKKDITSSDLNLSFIKLLQPVRYNYINTNIDTYGLIAQNVKQILDLFEIQNTSIVNKNENEKYYSIEYKNFIGICIAASQEHQKKINLLKELLNKYETI